MATAEWMQTLKATEQDLERLQAQDANLNGANLSSDIQKILNKPAGQINSKSGLRRDPFLEIDVKMVDDSGDDDSEDPRRNQRSAPAAAANSSKPTTKTVPTTQANPMRPTSATRAPTRPSSTTSTSRPTSATATRTPPPANGTKTPPSTATRSPAPPSRPSLGGSSNTTTSPVKRTTTPNKTTRQPVNVAPPASGEENIGSFGSFYGTKEPKTPITGPPMTYTNPMNEPESPVAAGVAGEAGDRYAKAKVTMLQRQVTEATEVRKKLDEQMKDLQKQLRMEREENRSLNQRVQKMEVELKKFNKKDLGDDPTASLMQVSHCLLHNVCYRHVVLCAFFVCVLIPESHCLTSFIDVM